MRLYSWLELFTARLRHFSRLRRSGARRLSRKPRGGALSLERLEDRMMMAAPQPFDLASLGGLGFTIDGQTVSDRAGFSIRSAGDVGGAPNGVLVPTVDLAGAPDGYDDLLITAPARGTFAGSTYLLLGGDHLTTLDGLDGATDGFIELTNLAGHGFVINGQVPNLNPDTLPGTNPMNNSPLITATGIGDFNGDGIADIAIAQPNTPASVSAVSPTSNGRVYVVWGATTSFANAIATGTFSLAVLDNTDTTDTFGRTGIRIHGNQAFAGGPPSVFGGRAGYSIAAAGDVDGDGYNDLIVGEPRYDDQPGSGVTRDHGRAYIVYGESVGFDTDGGWFDDALVSLGGGGTHTFEVTNPGPSQESNNLLGFSVTGIGDINGDGRDDFAVGATDAYSQTNGQTGRVYVVFGNERGSIATETGLLNGTNGFRIDGAETGDQIGWSLSNAGDVNGDGFDDLIIGAPYADVGGKINAGAAYVIFGRANFTGMASNILALRTDLNGTNGFRIEGQYAGDLAGFAVGGGGDIDGDGFDDIVVGAPAYSANSVANTGRVYVVFGRKTGFDPVNLFKDIVGTDPAFPNLNATQRGFAIDGVAAGDLAGWSVGFVGDVNGDGFADLSIGAPNAYAFDSVTSTSIQSGESYLVFGGNLRPRPGHQVGTSNAVTPETLDGAVPGGVVRDYLIGGVGSDTLLSDGGPDVLYGGQGDDFIHIPDANFFIPATGPNSDPESTRRIDGGLGEDTLIFNSTSTPGGPATPAGLTLDLTQIVDNRLRNIEVIDIRNGANTLILNAKEVRRLSTAGFTNPNQNSPDFPFIPPGPTGNYLMVRRSIGDVVLDVAGALPLGGWTKLYDVVDNRPNSATFGVTFEAYAQGNELGQNLLLIEDPAVLNLSQLDGYNPVTNGPSGSLTQPNGKAGVALTGAAPSDRAGVSVSGIGDVNNDGFDDFIVGVPGHDGNGVNSNTGAAYLIYGKGGTWDPTLDLRLSPTGDIAGTTNDGIRLTGVNILSNDDGAGVSVSALGDVDGDGYDDFIIGANRADRDSAAGTDTSEGEAYLLFGKTFSAWAGGDTFNLHTLQSGGGVDGYVLRGTVLNDFAGFAVGGGGDVNGDGLNDIIIGAFQADQTAGIDTAEGKTYVIFGGANSLAKLDLATGGPADGKINLENVGVANIGLGIAVGDTGFRLDGVTAGDLTGRFVSIAGDVNGDGLADLLVSGNGVDLTIAGNPAIDAGVSYLVFGKSSWSTTPVVGLGSINGVNGVRFNGSAAGDFAGFSASYAGDVNGDGFDDIVIGAYRTDVNGFDSGRSYVVFGKSNWAATGTAGMDLTTINGTNGFTVNGGGIRMYNNAITGGVHNAGFAVSGIGDFNGDGFDDVAIGVPRSDAHAQISQVDWSFGIDAPVPLSGFGDTGQLYVVYGKANWTATPTFDPDKIDGLNGFRVDGVIAGDYAGFAVRAAGDVNGDGLGDFVVGGHRADPNGNDSGTGYLVFGGSYPGTAKPVFGTELDNASVVGTNGAGVDLLIGRQGNDTVTSNGGDDILYGGQGDDTIVLTDAAFTGTRRVDGGNGVDSLTFAGTVAGAHLNLTQLGDNRIQNVERINISGGGDNTLTLSVSDVFNLSGNAIGAIGGSPTSVSLSNALTVFRNFGDVVNRGPGWTTATTALLDPVLDQFFERYTAKPNNFTGGTATLAIQSASVVISGNTAFVNGTTGDDAFVYDSVSNVLTVKLAGEMSAIAYDLDDVALVGGGTPVTNVVVNGFGGNDRVSMLGTNLDDSANVSNTTANALFGNGRTLSATNTETTTLDGRGQGTRDLLTLTGSGQNIDLRSTVLMPDGMNQLTVTTQGNRNLEIIDLTGAGDNSLTLDIVSVTAPNDTSTTTLTVLRNAGDSVTFADRPAWALDPNAEWDAGRLSFFERYNQGGELVRVQSTAVNVSGGTATINGNNLDNFITYDAPANDVTIDGVRYDLDLSGPVSTVNVNAAAGNDHLTILGTAGNDAVNLSAFAANASFSTGRTLNAASVETSIAFGQGGTDFGTMAGTAAGETLDAGPTDASLYGTGFFQQLQGFSQTTTTGNGGVDTAFLRDSAGNDTFVSSSTTAVLSGTGFSNTVNGFANVSAVATAGTDTASLTGTGGLDRFNGKAQIKTALLTGTGYSQSATGFDQVVANGGGGTSDIARLFDNQFNNQFIASQGDAQLKQGATLLLRAQNFETMVGSSVAGGFDTATLNGTAQNDKFFADPNQATLQGAVVANVPTFAVTQAGFDVTTANAGAGNDLAKLAGTSTNNKLTGGPTSSRLFNGGMDVTANGFDSVEVNGRGGIDTAIFTDGAGRDTFNSSPAQLFMDGSFFDIKASFFETAIANSTTGGRDTAKLTGSNRKDTFTGRPTTASLVTVGLTTTVNSFEIVEAKAVQGAQPDVATLFDSAGNDTFFGQGAIGKLSGAGYSNQVDMFDTVTIRGTGGVNRLSGDLTSLSYLFNQVGTWV